jgi:hypothetical protein
MEFKAQVILERPSAAKSSAQWCCEHQIAPLVLADVSEPHISCARLTSFPRKNSDHKPVVGWEWYMHKVERSHRVAEVR